MIVIDWKDYLFLEYGVPALLYLIVFVSIVGLFLRARENRIKKTLE